MSKKITRYEDSKTITNEYIELGDTVCGQAITQIWVSSVGCPMFVIGGRQYSWTELLLALPDENMNKHIELVKKWLNDPSSVTTEELRANRDSALDTHAKDFADHTAYSYAQAKPFADNTAYSAAYYNAYNAAYYAYVASNWNGSDIAAGYVKKYEELTAKKCNE